MFEYNEKYKKISSIDLKKWLDSKEEFVLLDVRTKEEYQNGHIPLAININDEEIYKKAEALIKDKDLKIVTYCLTGKRSRQAAKELIRLGYSTVFDLGGVMLWPYEIVR